MPEAGGEYVYLNAAYGPFSGIPLRLDSVRRGQESNLLHFGGRVFYTYLTVFLPGLAQPVVVTSLMIGPNHTPFEIHYGQLVAIALIMFLAGVNYVGVRVKAATSRFS